MSRAASRTQKKASGPEHPRVDWAQTLSHIRAVLFEEEPGAWSAQCLEFDIAAQAHSFFELQDELVRVLATHVAASRQLGREPFADIRPAPKRYWKLYETGLRVESRPASIQHADVPLPPIKPELRISRPPA